MVSKQKNTFPAIFPRTIGFSRWANPRFTMIFCGLPETNSLVKLARDLTTQQIVICHNPSCSNSVPSSSKRQGARQQMWGMMPPPQRPAQLPDSQVSEEEEPESSAIWTPSSSRTWYGQCDALISGKPRRNKRFAMRSSGTATSVEAAHGKQESRPITRHRRLTCMAKLTKWQTSLLKATSRALPRAWSVWNTSQDLLVDSDFADWNGHHFPRVRRCLQRPSDAAWGWSKRRECGRARISCTNITVKAVL